MEKSREQLTARLQAEGHDIESGADGRAIARKPDPSAVRSDQQWHREAAERVWQTHGTTASQLTDKERRLINRIRRLAVAIPILSAILAASPWIALTWFGLVYPTWRKTVSPLRDPMQVIGLFGIWPVSVIAVWMVVVRLHPIVRRRWLKAIAWSMLGAVSYIAVHVGSYLVAIRLMQWWIERH